MTKKNPYKNSPFGRMTDREWDMFCKKGYTGPLWVINPLEPWEKFYKRFKEWKRMWPKAKDRFDNDQPMRMLIFNDDLHSHLSKPIFIFQPAF